MALTRGNILDRIAVILGDDSTATRTFLTTSFDNMLFYLYDLHDWEWKHKSGTFNTVAGTESYDLSVSAPSIRSAQDVECIWDKTNGRFLEKIDLRDARKHYPKEDTSGQPIFYAPWGLKTIFLSDNPDGVYTIDYLYIAKAVASTSDSNTLETTLGLPDYIHYLFEKLVTAEGFLVYDDSRRNSMLEEIHKLWLPKAIEADMKHLESGARFKFWEEELSPTSLTYNDFLRRVWINS